MKKISPSLEFLKEIYEMIISGNPLIKKIFKESDLKEKASKIYEISLKDRYPVGLTKRDFIKSREDEEKTPKPKEKDIFGIEEEPEEKPPEREYFKVSPETKEEIKEPFFLSIRTELAKNLPEVVMKNLSVIKKISSILDSVLPYAEKKEYSDLISLRFRLDQIEQYLNEILKKLLETRFLDLEALGELENLSRDIKALEEIFKDIETGKEEGVIKAL